ncbi:MAG TPA: putative maltokinase [Gemmataceae bacterium]|nr:putative maltokinase [Gemmataceae bacterium]
MGREVPTLTAARNWEEVIQPRGRSALERLLPDYLRRRRWFGGKTKRIRSATLRDTIPIPGSPATVFYNLVLVEYADGVPELYALPLTFAGGDHAEQLWDTSPQAVMACLEGATNGVLFDALADASFGNVLLEAMRNKQVFRSGQGEIHATAFANDRITVGPERLSPKIGQAEQTNSSIIFGDQLILKCFRGLEEGVNLDLEIGSFLTQVGFPHSAAVAGAIEFRHSLGHEPITLAILQNFVPNRGDAWTYALKELTEYYKAIVAVGVPEPDLPSGHFLDLGKKGKPAACDYLRDAMKSAVILGARTAELHLALAKGRDPAFAPEPFSTQEQQALHQSLSDLHGRVFALLRSRFGDLPESVQVEARHVLDRSGAIPDRFERILQSPFTSQRIRCHGDYHLGQVLYTGQDFVIIDFEGEPARPLAERRRKASPLRDVAGMIRSFHYAAHSGLPAESAGLQPWAEFWYSWISEGFLIAYLTTIGYGIIVPASRQELELLLDAFLLEKAMYELGYELNHRPDWVRIPLRGIAQLLSNG